ncbi:hypothetical protein ACIP2Y_32545 [Streptomyces sviceus]|uniref:hypothetical protein n=1 Tax=Streptomyces sviceus TaxID=285530 RepID=UPI00380F15E5
MQTTTSTRETTSTTLRRHSGTARSPAVPPGLVIPLVVAGLPAWRTNGWTTGLALGAGLFIGVGAILTPSSRDTALIASTVAQLVALPALVIAGAAACLTRKGARA